MSGFFRIAPRLLAGVYQISNRQGNGEAIDFFEFLASPRGNGQTCA